MCGCGFRHGASARLCHASFFALCRTHEARYHQLWFALCFACFALCSTCFTSCSTCFALCSTCFALCYACFALCHDFCYALCVRTRLLGFLLCACHVYCFACATHRYPRWGPHSTASAVALAAFALPLCRTCVRLL